MAESEVSLQGVFDQVEQLDTLPLPLKVSGLAALITAQASKASAPERVFLRVSLCGALLKTLRPTQSAAEVTQTRLGCTAAHCSPSKGQPSTPSTSAAPSGTSAAQACWTSAATALQTIYSWEDEEVVLAIIEFWNTASGLLCGSWLQQSHHQQQQPQGPKPASSSQDTNAHAAPCLSHPLQGNYPTGPPAHPSTAATEGAATAAASHAASSSSPELQYLSWLWTLGPAGRPCST